MLISITTLSTSWGITTLNIRYSSRRTMAQVSRMLASRYAITRPTSTGDRMDASFDTIRCSVPFI